LAARNAELTAQNAEPTARAAELAAMVAVLRMRHPRAKPWSQSGRRHRHAADQPGRDWYTI